MKAISIIGMLMIMIWSCTPEGPDIFVTESGLTCELHNTSDDQVKCENGDVIQFHLVVQDHRDSILSNTNEVGGPQSLKVEPSIFNGDIMEGIRLMGKGDSVSFYVPVDSIYLGVPSLPKHALSGTKWKYSIKILSHKTREDLKNDALAIVGQHAQRMRADIASKSEQIELDQKIIEAYLAKENINAELQPEGYYLEMKNNSNGKVAVPADKVSVHYTGKLLDGTKFDSSHDRGRPLEFTLGIGEVIYGWDLAMEKISQGSEATIYLPSSLGYGVQGFGGGRIPANAPLQFDIQVLDIK